MTTKHLILAGAAFLGAAPVAAQTAPCTTGPGAAFGVIAYQCSSCGINNANGRTTFEFQAEPVIQQVSGESALKPGDIIQAVNGSPILTAAGAQLFTYPRFGEHTITVRRDGERKEIATSTTDVCQQFTPGYIKKPALRIRDGNAFFKDTGVSRFGFAVACLPACTRTKINGIDYWKWEGHPAIATVLVNSPAARAGLQVGDRITHINGVSILNDSGVVLFDSVSSSGRLRVVGPDRVVHSERYTPADVVHIKVLRDGQPLDFTLKIGG
jgi:membrane-associated protease RseP (regulator of RpoE activity)